MSGSLLLLVPIGALIGALLGSVGGGGSLLAVPALVYLGEQGVRSAQAGALVVVVLASSVGVVSYLRQDDVRWRAGIVFGAAAGITSLGASLVSRHLDPDLLLLAFAPVMVVGAYAMLREQSQTESGFRPWRYGVSAGGVARVAALGLVVGVLIGLFGVGGGFIIVPSLVLVLDFGLTEAVGTSLLVVIVGSLTALAERLQDGAIDWGIVGPFAGAAIAGVLAGSWIGERVPNEALARAFAALMGAVAIYTGVDALAGLTS